MTTLFTRYARLSMLCVFLIVAAGLGSLAVLGRQEDPTLIERYATVVTEYPGASAERVEAQITEPIEAALLELAEVTTLQSTSRAGASVFGVELREDLNDAEVDRAWTLVREQIDVARQDFPAGAGIPELERQYIGAATMLVEISWEDGGDRMLGLLARLARDLEDRFQSMPGTEETQLFGAPEEEVRVVVDADRLAALGLTTNDLAGIIAASDARAPAGQIRAEGVTLGVEVRGEIDSLGRIRETPILQTPDGRTVRVGDVAQVEKEIRLPPSEIALADGRRAIFVGAYLQPGLRVDQWTARARDVVEGFRAETPRGINVTINFEQDVYVERRLSGLAVTLGYSALLVFAVLFVMMGWRSALIVGSALPLTLLLVLFLFRLSGEPLHQMSVTGLVIALGMLIDNAIVMVDEYRILRRKGFAPLDAVDKSVRLLFAPLLASTVTTMLAFAPIAMLPGSAGEFVGFIGVSVIFAVGSSLLLAMTIVPAFAAWFDREAKPDEPRRFWRDGLTVPPLAFLYRQSLRLVARLPIIGVAVAFALPAVGFYVASTLPMQFFPRTERDMFQVELVMPPETSIEGTRREVARATELIMSYEGVRSVNWMVGSAPPRTYYNVPGFQSNDPGFAAAWVMTEGPAVTRRVATALQSEGAEQFPRARFLSLPFEQGPPVPAPIALRVFGPEFATLNTLAEQVRLVIADAPRTTFTVAEMSLGAPVARVNADEAALDQAGRRLADLASVLRADLDGVLAGSLLEGVEELPVRVYVDEEARGTLESVRSRLIPSSGDTLGSPVSAFGPITLEPDTAVVARFNGERVNTVYGFLEPYSVPSETLAVVLERLEEADFDVPSGYRLEIAGEAEESGEAFANLFSAAVPLLIIMVGSLVLAFNNFSYAGVVALVGAQSVGLAMFGVWLFGQDNGFNAIIGAMGLVGLAINGAIVVLTALRADPKAASGDPDAIAATTGQATRHILATTFTTIGGFMPLLLKADPFWMPMAAAFVGGVAGSAVLALYFAPSMFAVIARGKARQIARQARRAQEHADAAAAPAE